MRIHRGKNNGSSHGRGVSNKAVRFIRRCRLVIIPVAAVLIAIGYFLCSRGDIRPIIPGELYRSGQLTSPELDDAIQTYSLKSIFNLRGKNNGIEWYDMEKNIADGRGVTLRNFSFSAETLPNIAPLINLVNSLKTTERPLLVHCLHGADRTSFVSALILALRDDVPYEHALKQISWRFGVFPGSDSAGPLFFERYEAWLRKTELEHRPERLRSWIRQDYIDGSGNMEYFIDTVQGRKLTSDRREKGWSTTLVSGSAPVTIEGWAYDRRYNRKIVHMTVALNDTIRAAAQFTRPRPDVARYLELPDDDGGTGTHLGWIARFDGNDLDPGSYAITLHRDTPEGRTITVSTGCTITVTR